MPARSKGARLGTRKTLAKALGQKGKVRISAFLQSFNTGDRVQIRVEPAYHKGMPFRRFFGKEGIVIKKQGSAYLVNVREGNMYKKVLCAPVHLKRV